MGSETFDLCKVSSRTPHCRLQRIHKPTCTRTHALSHIARALPDVRAHSMHRHPPLLVHCLLSCSLPCILWIEAHSCCVRSVCHAGAVSLRLLECIRVSSTVQAIHRLGKNYRWSKLSPLPEFPEFLRGVAVLTVRLWESCARASQAVVAASQAGVCV